MANKYAHLKAKARELRQRGFTLPEIVDMLKLPKTTVYGWIKDIEVEIQRTAKQTEAQKTGTKAMQSIYKKKRDDAYAQGEREAPELFKNPLFRDFVNMYLGEGFKRGRNVIEVANSNIQVMKLTQYWFRQLANPSRKLIYRIQYHQDQDVDEIKQHWANGLGISTDNIQVLRKSNSNQLTGRKFRSQYGVLSIRVSDTYLRARLQAWLDYLEKQWVDLQ